MPYHAKIEIKHPRTMKVHRIRRPNKDLTLDLDPRPKKRVLTSIYNLPSVSKLRASHLRVKLRG